MLYLSNAPLNNFYHNNICIVENLYSGASAQQIWRIQAFKHNPKATLARCVCFSMSLVNGSCLKCKKKKKKSCLSPVTAKQICLLLFLPSSISLN